MLIEEELMWVVDAFQSMVSDRQISPAGTMLGIPTQAIIQYGEKACGIHDPDEMTWFVDVVQALDRAQLKHFDATAKPSDKGRTEKP